jgi:hypothetical protein
MYLAMRKYLLNVLGETMFLHYVMNEDHWRIAPTEEVSDLIIFALMDATGIPKRENPPAYFTDAEKVAFNQQQDALYQERKQLWDKWRAIGLNPEGEDAGGLPFWINR